MFKHLTGKRLNHELQTPFSVVLFPPNTTLYQDVFTEKIFFMSHRGRRHLSLSFAEQSMNKDSLGTSYVPSSMLWAAREESKLWVESLF